MNPRVNRVLEKLELGVDGIYSAALPQSSQPEEIALREAVAAQRYADHLTTISRHHSIEVMNHEVQRFLAGVPSDAVIIDVGGGWGWHWRHLKQLRPRVALVIVDFVRANLVHAQEMLGDLVNDQIFLVHGDATALPFDNSTVDGFWSVQTLQHIPEFETAVAEAWRVLRVSGAFANYSLNAAKLVRAVYSIAGRRYHVAGPVKGLYYLERASHSQLEIVRRIFGVAPSVRYTEILFQPDLRLTMPGWQGSLLGRLDALLGGPFRPWSLIARQCSYHVVRR